MSEQVYIQRLDTTAAPYINSNLVAERTGDGFDTNGAKKCRFTLDNGFGAATTFILKIDQYDPDLADWAMVHEVAAGGASTEFNATYTIGAAKKWTVVVDISPFSRIRARVSGGGVPTVGDTVKVWRALILG
jgi:hypothetical protein